MCPGGQIINNYATDTEEITKFKLTQSECIYTSEKGINLVRC